MAYIKPVTKALTAVLVAGTLMTGCSKSESSKTTAAKPSLECIPQSCNILVKADVEKITTIEAVAKQINSEKKSPVQEAFAAAGFKVEDVKTIHIAVNAEDQTKEPILQ